MKIAIEVNNSDLDKLTEELKQMSIEKLDTLQKTDSVQFVCMIEPSKFRTINEQIKQSYKNGSIEVLVAHMSNKEVQGIEEVGEVDLQVREEWKKTQ